MIYSQNAHHCLFCRQCCTAYAPTQTSRSIGCLRCPSLKLQPLLPQPHPLDRFARRPTSGGCRLAYRPAGGLAAPLRCRRPRSRCWTSAAQSMRRAWSRCLPRPAAARLLGGARARSCASGASLSVRAASTHGSESGSESSRRRAERELRALSISEAAVGMVAHFAILLYSGPADSSRPSTLPTFAGAAESQLAPWLVRFLGPWS